MYSFRNSVCKPLILGRKLGLEEIGRGLGGKEEMCIHATKTLVVCYMPLKWRKYILLTQSLQSVGQFWVFLETQANSELCCLQTVRLPLSWRGRSTRERKGGREGDTALQSWTFLLLMPGDGQVHTSSFHDDKSSDEKCQIVQLWHGVEEQKHLCYSPHWPWHVPVLPGPKAGLVRLPVSQFSCKTRKGCFTCIKYQLSLFFQNLINHN